MGSRQAIKEENRVAVDNKLSDVNKERRRTNEQQGTWPDSHDQSYNQQQQQEQKGGGRGGGGVFGSLLKSAEETYDQVKSAVSSKTSSTASTDQEYGSGEKVGGSDAVSGRMAELKESAAAAARRARDHLTGQSEALHRKGDEDKYERPEFEARQKMQELKLKEEGVHDEAKQRASADWETAADRGIAARSNIYGAMGSLKESIKEKLTYPMDIVHEARASQEYGGPKRGRGEKMAEDIGEGPTGPAAMPSVRTSD